MFTAKDESVFLLYFKPNRFSHQIFNQMNSSVQQLRRQMAGDFSPGKVRDSSSRDSLHPHHLWQGRYSIQGFEKPRSQEEQF